NVAIFVLQVSAESGGAVMFAGNQQQHFVLGRRAIFRDQNQVVVLVDEFFGGIPEDALTGRTDLQEMAITADGAKDVPGELQNSFIGVPEQPLLLQVVVQGVVQ